MVETRGKFYIGRPFDPQRAQVTRSPMLYNPDDLTTHAAVVGMTGSGKTGLCIDILEEAALNNLPALMIDPKGDITNTLLHFPDLSPQDFQPWLNPDQVRREGKSMDDAARETADQWRKGLDDWEIKPERLQALTEAAQFAVYTPGSDAGIPVSILASLQAPDLPWDNNREPLREKITSTATALLGLVGLEDIDPVQSREHILLSNIFEAAWSSGKDLTLGELILQTQSPPFEKLGVFDVDTFFPQKERFELAMLLNNMLAAPAFQSWSEGQPLDIPSLLYGPDGRPRHSIFYIAHLSEAERMFFVTLLYSAVESWMRTLSGTTSLRAILYFDEIYGYLPPVGNPPSKQPMLRMLKQARAFGVSQVLVTQNPVDLDYKALSNAGTWFIGKLQTENDKQRLLDGLQGAAPGINRREYDRLISTLGKRVFLLHNVHEKQPTPFQTRWAMNYLAGPLTRAQIPALNSLVGAVEPEEPASTPLSATPPQPRPTGVREAVGARKAAPSAPSLAQWGSTTRTAIPNSVREYFLPNNLTLSQAFKAAGRDYPPQARSLGLLYRPALLSQARIRYLKRKYNLNYEGQTTALLDDPDPAGSLRWEEHGLAPLDAGSLDEPPAPNARFAELGPPFTGARTMSALEKDFVDWAYHTQQAMVRANEALDIFAGPEVSQAEFRRMCTQAAQEQREEEMEKTAQSYHQKLDRIEERLEREKRELEEDEEELSQRKMEEWGTHAENLLGLFGGRRRRLSTSFSKRRMTKKAKSDVEESRETIEDYQEDMKDLEEELADELEEIQEKWRDIVQEETEIPVSPYKKDILVELFGVAWKPFHIVQIGEQVIELPGFGRP
jgi:hypothetical protein